MIMALTLLILLIPILVSALIWFIWRPKWIGYEEVTFWEWVKVLSVPLVIGFVTFMVSSTQSRVENARSAEEAVQGYFQRIGQIALDARLATRPEIARALGRAETAAVLRIAQGERAGRVFAFLAEMDLLQDYAVEFQGLDLRESDLKGFDLRGLDFEDSDLRGSEFEETDLSGVDFEGADLRGVDFKGANLTDVDFTAANLRRADFDGARLFGADLSAAKGLSRAQVLAACTGPDTLLPPDMAAVPFDGPDCGPLED